MKSNPSSRENIFPPISEEDLASDEFFKELEVAFDDIQLDLPKKKEPLNKGKSKPEDVFGKIGQVGEMTIPETMLDGMAAMHATYVELAQGHLNPVARYLKAIRMGIQSKDVLEVVELVIDPLARKTKKVGLLDHASDLRAFLRVIRQVLSSSDKKITDKDSSSLSFAFAPVSKRFEVKTRGHSTAVLNVVAFYQSLKKSNKVQAADLKKLFAIGISSLTMLRQTPIEELSSLTGIKKDRVKILRDYAREFTLFELV